MLHLKHTALCFLLLLTVHGYSQETASITGSVVNGNQVGIELATVNLESADHQSVRTITSGRKGVFAFDGLMAGKYTLSCNHRHYATVRIPLIEIHPGEQRSLSIDLGSLIQGESPTMDDTTAHGVSVNLSNETIFDPKLLKTLPWNGRNAATVAGLAPGITEVSIPSASPLPQQSAYFLNGLRSNSSYLLLDGVTPLPGSSGMSPSLRGVTTSDWRHSLDALREAVVVTTPIVPVLGRTPGAQVLLQSRSGGNEFHGSVYGYFRNRGLTANDWFANNANLEKADQDYKNFGATAGGAIQRNRTFYFLSYEGLRANLPQTSVMDVPNESVRSLAPSAMQPFLQAFPLPNSATSTDESARFTAVTTSHWRMNPMSARLDHRLSDNVHAFFRYGYIPTDGDYAGSGFQSAASVTRYDATAHSLTGGLTWNASSRVTNDLRVNYSRNTVGTTSALNGLGGAIPLNLANTLPDGATAENSLVQLNVLGVGGYSVGMHPKLRQEQVHVTNGISLTEQRHTFKFGVDYRRIFSTLFQPAYSVQATFRGLGTESGAALSGTAANAVVASHEPAVYPGFTNFSLYAEDAFRATERLTLLYGIRWDVDPAPEVRRGPSPISLDGVDVSRFQSLYNTSWGNISPRLGLAYQLDTTSGKEMVLRMGFGVFRDTPYSSFTELVGGAPFTSRRILPLVSFPLTQEQASSPSLPPQRPYGQINVADGLLKAPNIMQWNATIERMMGGGQSLSIGYVGTRGRDLLLTENQALFTSDYSVMRSLTNSASSNYHGLQLAYRRPMGSALTTQVSYTWAHSTDTASEDHAVVLPGFTTLRNYESGDSDFDVRHMLSFIGSYRFPSPGEGVLRAAFKDWSAEWMISARSALPLDVVTMTEQGSDTDDTVAEGSPGLFALVRANYMGLPAWISDSSAPGGKRLNPEAFAVPEGYTQGTLGRNLIRGFGMFQADLSLSRRVTLSERMNLLVQAQAFNVLNTANFTNPLLLQGANLASSNFGYSSGIAGSGSGGAAPATFGRGGPRTLQLGLRIEF